MDTFFPVKHMLIYQYIHNQFKQQCFHCSYSGIHHIFIINSEFVHRDFV